MIIQEFPAAFKLRVISGIVVGHVGGVVDKHVNGKLRVLGSNVQQRMQKRMQFARRRVYNLVTRKVQIKRQIGNERLRTIGDF